MKELLGGRALMSPVAEVRAQPVQVPEMRIREQAPWDFPTALRVVDSDGAEQQ